MICEWKIFIIIGYTYEYEDICHKFKKPIIIHLFVRLIFERHLIKWNIMRL
jgi:hypothetical protein